MVNQEIMKLVYQIAEVKSGKRLTEDEKEQLHIIFCNSSIQDINERCAYTIKYVLDIDISEDLLLERRSINFSLDAIQMLMLQLKKEATKAAVAQSLTTGNKRK